MVGKVCQNRCFHECRYSKMEVFKTADNRGFGLRSKEDIAEGQFIIEYVGELISKEEADKRAREDEDGNRSYYIIRLDATRFIDAGPKGNLSRFMNHSCDPNCQPQVWQVRNDFCVGLFALKDIPKGTALSFNYNLEIPDGNELKKCYCGALVEEVQALNTRLDDLEEQAEDDDKQAKLAAKKADEARTQARESSQKVREALRTVQSIQQQLSDLDTVDEERLRELDSRLTEMEEKIQAANLDGRLAYLRQARARQEENLQAYTRQFDELQADVDNVERIRASLPNQCFRVDRLEIGDVGGGR